jgi:hypothetical protein
VRSIALFASRVNLGDDHDGGTQQPGAHGRSVAKRAFALSCEHGWARVHGRRAVQGWKGVAGLPAIRERGRLTPDGLTHVDSWVDEALCECFQVMRTDDRALLDAWIARWSDLVDFEVYPVITSAEAAARAL